MTFAAATWDTAAFSAVLKEYYLPPAIEILHQRTVLLSRMGRDTEHIEGQYAVTPLHTGRNEGHGFIGKGGKLPQPKQQAWKETRYTVKYGYGRFMLPGPDMAEAQSDAGSFLRLAESEMTRLPKDIAKTINAYLFSNGSGVMCRIVSIAGAPSYTCDLGLGYTHTSNPTKWLREGMVIVACNPAGGAPRGTARTITSITPSTNTFTTDAALGGAVNGDYICIASEPGVTPAAIDCGYDNVPMGLKGIWDDIDPLTKAAGLQNLTVAANTFWVASVLGNSGVLRGLTLDLLQQGQDTLEQVADHAGTIFLSDFAQRRVYVRLMESAKRYVNTMDLDGGFRALSYNGVPFVVDPDAPGGIIWHFDENELAFFIMKDWHFLDKDGSVLSRDGDRDMWQGCLASYFETGVMNRRAGIVYEDLAD